MLGLVVRFFSKMPLPQIEGLVQAGANAFQLGWISTLKAGRDPAAASVAESATLLVAFQYPQSGSRLCRRMRVR